MNEFKNILNKYENNSTNTTTHVNNKYACAICGKSYKTIEERIKCESKCVEERNKVEAKMAQMKLDEEKNTRMVEIDHLQKELNKKIASYVNDYGAISLINCNRSFMDILDLIL